MTIDGTMVGKPGSKIVTVLLRGIALDNGKSDQTTYFCRCEEPETET